LQVVWASLHSIASFSQPRIPVRCTPNAHRASSHTSSSALLLAEVGHADKLRWAFGPPIAVSGVTGVPRQASWDAWLKLGQDEGSVVADAQFVDPAKRDYGLKPSSPALKLGFNPIDLSTVDNYVSSDRRTWPRAEVKVVRHAMDYSPLATANKPQAPLRDYEDYAVGESDRRIGRRLEQMD